MKYLLFDIDNTLLDFDAAEEYALQKVYEKYDIEWNTVNQITYKTINKAFWTKHEKGEISRAQLFSERFPKVFKAIGVDGNFDGMTIDQEYRSFLAESTVPVPRSFEVLEQLKNSNYSLFAVTNGATDVSRPRLEKSKMANYFEDIFVSGEIGAQKPQVEFFDYVFENIPGFEKEDAVIIGDTFSSDILGGLNAGIKTIWFNPKKNPAPKDLEADFEIRNLEDIISIVER
jgi:2-haloacid dehalogenase